MKHQNQATSALLVAFNLVAVSGFLAFMFSVS